MNHLMGFCSSGYQCIKTKSKDVIVEENTITPIFDLTNDRPFVKPNQTLIKLENGKAKVKPNNFKCIIVWCFWDKYPATLASKNGNKINLASLEKQVKFLEEQLRKETDNKEPVQDDNDVEKEVRDINRPGFEKGMIRLNCE